jgi:hypothetical protein
VTNFKVRSEKMEDVRKNIRTRITLFVFIIVVVMTRLCIAGPATTAEPDWPREIVVPEGTITLYQPQIESFEGNKLTARAAVSIIKKGETEPAFGAVWFDARVSTDRDTRIVTLLDLNVPMVKFPNADPAKVQQLQAVLNREIPKWDPTISLDRVLAMLDLVEKEKKAASNYKTTPPKIIVVKHPAVLVTIDGEPQLSKVDDSDLMRVVNTPFFIVLDPKTNKYYLKGGSKWLSAGDIKGPWRSEPNPPASVKVEAAKETESSQQDADRTDQRIPQIIVSTEPAELIVIDGEPKYTPISGSNLLGHWHAASLCSVIGSLVRFVKAGWDLVICRSR